MKQTAFVESLGTDNSKLSLYPNPFTSVTTLEIGDQFNVEKVTLLNVLGETVRTINRIQGNSITIESGDLSPGLYFLQVQAVDLYVIKMLIK